MVYQFLWWQDPKFLEKVMFREPWEEGTEEGGNIQRQSDFFASSPVTIGATFHIISLVHLLTCWVPLFSPGFSLLLITKIDSLSLRVFSLAPLLFSPLCVRITFSSLIVPLYASSVFPPFSPLHLLFFFFYYLSYPLCPYTNLSPIRKHLCLCEMLWTVCVWWEQVNPGPLHLEMTFWEVSQRG